MSALTWFIVGALILWLGTAWLFVALSRAKALLERGELHRFWRVSLYPALPIFLVLDFAWNVVVGTIAFRELPRELLFTSRVKRHLRHSRGSRQRRAKWWADRLNELDPGHVTA